MKIIQVVPRFPPAIGGMESHVYNVSKELVRRGHRVTVVTSDEVDGKKRGVRREVIDGIEILSSPLFMPKFFREYWLIPGIFNILRDLRGDVAHIHGYRCLSSSMAALYFKLKGIPVVFTPHGIYPKRNPLDALIKSIFDYWLGNWLLRFSRRVIALTENNRQLLLKIGCPRNKIVIVPNGVDVEKYKKLSFDAKEMKEKHGFFGPLLLYVGRIDWSKGVESIVEALPLISKEFAGTKLLIVGPDYRNYAPNLLKLSQKLGVRDCMTLTGVIPEDQVRLYYSMSDAFILPSVYEGLSSSMLEAMASKVPVIALPTGGTRDVFVHGFNAVLIKEASPDEISNAVTALLNNPKLREKICGNAFSLVYRKYAWKAIVSKLESVYEGILVEND